MVIHKFFQYNILLSIFLCFGNVILIAQSPGWVKPNPSQYSYSANAICALFVDDIRINNPDDRIAFFVGTELRGLGTPIHVGNGNYLHFVTLYSNVAVENMDVKIYHNQTGIVYNSIDDVTFEVQSQLGSLDAPYNALGYTTYDAPISIDDIPSLTSLQGEAFDTIELAGFLNQPDTNQVIWTYTPDPNFNVVLNGSSLIVTPDTAYFGTSYLTVRATEVSANQLYAEKTIVFQVVEAYAQPLLYGIFNQGIEIGQSFIDFDLNEYENQYDGPCLNFDYEPILTPFPNGDTIPTWSLSGFPQTNMTLTLACQFTPKHTFDHVNDRLAFFVGDSLRAVGFPNVHNGKVLYFVTVGGSNLETEKMELRFYSGALQKVFYLLTDYNYVPHNVIGNADAPIIFDFSPLEPFIDVNGNVEIMIRDAAWTGEQRFLFKAYDCQYPQYFYDQAIASYCIVPDSSELQPYYYDGDGDGSGSPSNVIFACSQPESGWVLIGTDCNDNDPLVLGIALNINILENSGVPNDGVVCSGSSAMITLDGPTSFLWENGETTSSIQVNPSITTTYNVSISSGAGCTIDTNAIVIVEGTVVTSPEDSGGGTLRNVLECVIDGGNIYYDQPLNDYTIITNLLIINKNVHIIGLSPSQKPIIGVDFEMLSNGLNISQNKILQLHNVDLKVINPSQPKAFFEGGGQVLISGSTTVIE